DPNLPRIDTEFLGPRPDGADRALGVLQGDRVAITFSAVPIVADKSGDAMVVQPAADLRSFVIHRQVAVTAAGTDDDPGASGFLWQIDDQLRLVLVGLAEGA